MPLTSIAVALGPGDMKPGLGEERPLQQQLKDFCSAFPHKQCPKTRLPQKIGSTHLASAVLSGQFGSQKC